MGKWKSKEAVNIGSVYLRSSKRGYWSQIQFTRSTSKRVPLLILPQMLWLSTELNCEWMHFFVSPLLKCNFLSVLKPKLALYFALIPKMMLVFKRCHQENIFQKNYAPQPKKKKRRSEYAFWIGIANFNDIISTGNNGLAFGNVIRSVTVWHAATQMYATQNESVFWCCGE